MRSGKCRYFSCALLAAFILISLSGHLNGAENEKVIKITAKKFEYSPNKIDLKKGEPVVLEFTTLDRVHGFNCPGLGIRIDIRPGKENKLKFVPGKVGTFPFHCDNFCGSGHDGMTGTITVTE
jgi:cytochrome c oxidase subunit II